MKNFALRTRLETLKQQGLYRSRRIIESPQSSRIIIDGCECLNFCSNDYLGLANHPKVVQAFQAATNIYGVGSGSAHLICGHSVAHHNLEAEIAAFTGNERAVLFSTGYMANIGVITALLGRGDAVFEDKLNHASLLDGGLFSGAKFKRYLHADMQNLANKLQTSTAQKKLIISDGVFSMDGDIAPIKDLVKLSQQHQAALMLDDAHGFGVLGATGAGTLEHNALQATDVDILVGTFGKAFGTAGAFVAGSEALIETLIQAARTYIYTTAMPAAIAVATSASLKLLMHETWRRETLHSLIMQFKQGATQLGLQLMPSDSAIQPILIGETNKTVAISQKLLQLGFLVTAIRPPTVSPDTARLRITLTSQHKTQDVDALLTALAQVIT